LKSASEIKIGTSGEVLKPSKLDILTDDKREKSDEKSTLPPTRQLPKDEVDSPGSNGEVTDKPEQ
jgi:hypothetical protein